jgi:hypothetical protein
LFCPIVQSLKNLPITLWRYCYLVFLWFFKLLNRHHLYIVCLFCFHLISAPLFVLYKKRRSKKGKKRVKKRIKKKREAKDFEGELCCGCLLKVHFHSKLVVIYIAATLYILSTLFHLVDTTVSPPCLATYSSTSHLKPGLSNRNPYDLTTTFVEAANTSTITVLEDRQNLGK